VTTPHAVFALAPTWGEGWAATTRPTAPGRLGLPGGKVEPGEDPRAALKREAREEGWVLLPASNPYHHAYVDGRLVWWYWAPLATRLSDWAERGRVEPVAIPLAAVVASGYGNDGAVAAARLQGMLRGG